MILGPAQTGKIRIIAIPTESRVGGALADVPTWKEQGVDAVFSTWRVIVGPKGMTPEQIAWWDNTLAKVTASPEWQTALGRDQWTADYLDSEQAADFFGSENSRLTALLTDLGLAKHELGVPGRSARCRRPGAASDSFRKIISRRSGWLASCISLSRSTISMRRQSSTRTSSASSS